MNKFNSLKAFGYNWIQKIQFNSQYDAKLVQLLTRIGPRPIVLDKNSVQVAVLENSYDVVISQEVGSVDEIKFSLPMDDSKRELIQNEGYVQMFDDIYVIREITDKKDDKSTEVFAEAIWYDLQYCEPFPATTWTAQTATKMMNDVLAGTGWSVGDVFFTNTRDFAVTDVTQNILSILGNIEKLFQGELWFDTQAKTVSLLSTTGTDTGASIMYDKNASSMSATYDTRDMVTKLYLYGKNSMSISDANNGVPYLEDYSYTTVKRVSTIQSDAYTNPFQLKEMGQNALAILSKPQTTYSITMADVQDQIGLEHEKLTIGGIVRVYDNDLNLDSSTRIMKWDYDVINPDKTTIQLESVTKTLSDLLTAVDNGASVFDSSQSVDKAEMLTLSVFNYLMNSRADDGFSYWTNTGWEIDPLNGSTGNTSFLCNGELGKDKYLTQTIYPSSSDDYAISFQAYADSIVKGPDGQIGVLVTITYDDNSTDTKFIALA